MFDVLSIKMRPSVRKGLVFRKEGSENSLELFTIAEVYEVKDKLSSEEFINMVNAFSNGCNFIQIWYGKSINNGEVWEAIKCINDEVFDDGVHLWSLAFHLGVKENIEEALKWAKNLK